MRPARRCRLLVNRQGARQGRLAAPPEFVPARLGPPSPSPRLINLSTGCASRHYRQGVNPLDEMAQSGLDEYEATSAHLGTLCTARDAYWSRRRRRDTLKVVRSRVLSSFVIKSGRLRLTREGANPRVSTAPPGPGLSSKVRVRLAVKASELAVTRQS
jgi:hypothetical protein